MSMNKIPNIKQNILEEEYLEEQKKGFTHTLGGALIPKRDENSVAVLPESWDGDWDESIVKEYVYE